MNISSLPSTPPPRSAPGILWTSTSDFITGNENPETTGVPLEANGDYATLLWRVVQKHNEKKHAPLQSNKSFFEKIWEIFLRFIRWLGGRTQPTNADELQLRYAMSVFDNYNPSLLTPQKPEEFDQWPFSSALETHCQYLKSCESKLKIPKNTLAALERCQKYAKEIENARSACTSHRRIILEKLTEDIQQAIDKLPKGEKLFFPGGLMDYSDVSDILAGRKGLDFTNRPTAMTHMIYEIKRNPEGSHQQFTFRIYNYSSLIFPLIHHEEGLAHIFGVSDSKIHFVENATETPEKPAPYTEYALSSEDFYPHISTLLEVQAPPHMAY